jgi:hypothetical protein
LQSLMAQSASDFGLKETAKKAKAVRDGDRVSASLRQRNVTQPAYRKPLLAQADGGAGNSIRPDTGNRVRRSKKIERCPVSRSRELKAAQAAVVPARSSALVFTGASRWVTKVDETVSSVWRKPHGILDMRVDSPYV